MQKWSVFWNRNLKSISPLHYLRGALDSFSVAVPQRVLTQLALPILACLLSPNQRTSTSDPTSHSLYTTRKGAAATKCRWVSVVWTGAGSTTDGECRVNRSEVCAQVESVVWMGVGSMHSRRSGDRGADGQGKACALSGTEPPLPVRIPCLVRHCPCLSPVRFSLPLTCPCWREMMATWRSRSSQPGSPPLTVPLLSGRHGRSTILEPFSCPLCPQIQPFFSSCLNDCLRHSVTVSCPEMPDIPGRGHAAVPGHTGSASD